MIFIKKEYWYFIGVVVIIIVGFLIYRLTSGGNNVEKKATKKINISKETVTPLYSDDQINYYITVEDTDSDIFYSIDDDVIGLDFDLLENEETDNKQFNLSVNGNIVDIPSIYIGDNSSDINISKLGKYLVFASNYGLSMGNYTIYIVSSNGNLIKSIKELENVSGMRPISYSVDSNNLVIEGSRIMSGPTIEYGALHNICSQTIDLLDKKIALLANYSYPYSDNGIDFENVKVDVNFTIEDYLKDRSSYCE